MIWVKLREREREAHKFTFLYGEWISRLHLWNCENSVRRIVLYAEKLDGKPVTPSERTRQQHEQNISRGRLRWRRIWTMGQRWGDWRVRLRWWEIMFLDMGRHWVCLTVQTIQGPPGEKKRRKGKGKRQRTIQKDRKSILWNGGKKKTEFGGPKERKARRACQKAMMASIRVVFALTSPTKEQARTFAKTKARERTKKEKAKKEPILNPDSQPQKHPMKKDIARPRSQTIGLPVIGLTTLGLQMLGGSAQGLTLHGWWQPCWILSTIQHIFRLDQERRDRNLQWKLHYQLSNNSTMFHQGWCTWDRWCAHLVFSLSQMKNLGETIELDPKGDKITCPAFGLYSSPAEHSTVGNIVLDLTNLAYQSTTKSREQSGHPKRHVTFALSEWRPAYPAHAPDMDEDEDEDDKPLVRPASRKEPAEEKRDLDSDDEDLLPLVPPRPPPVSCTSAKKDSMAGPSCHNGTLGSQGLARECRYLHFSRKAECEALRNIISKLSEERNLRDFHLKHLSHVYRTIQE